MRVLIYEDNLIWSARLVRSVRAFGHEAIVVDKPEPMAGDVAILNLGSLTLPTAELAPKLQAAGVVTIAHAGHKEKPLHEMGRQAGCDILATNSELTHKIEELLDRAAGLRKPG